jgi:hypothetical protein
MDLLLSQRAAAVAYSTNAPSLALALIDHWHNPETAPITLNDGHDVLMWRPLDGLHQIDGTNLLGAEGT